jgi:pSer/pThr/pTyr-binding forkhead associated (FHA) protein
MLLRNNSIFSFSSTLILVKIENNLIQLKILYGTNQNNEYSFNSNEKQYIKLGRIKNNDIDLEFNDESTSRIQTTIFYENNNWYIIDGDGSKKSLNGTWYFADIFLIIKEGMIFRAGTTSFKAHLYIP